MTHMTDSISEGLPPEIEGASAWYGPELDRHRDWIACLSSTELVEVDKAVKKLAIEHADVGSILSEHFPLPTLGLRLRNLLDEVLNGRGFVLLRALPVESWTKLESALAFYGIGTHLGKALHKTPRVISWVTSKTSGFPAWILPFASIRLEKGRPITQIPLMWFASCA